MMCERCCFGSGEHAEWCRVPVMKYLDKQFSDACWEFRESLLYQINITRTEVALAKQMKLAVTEMATYEDKAYHDSRGLHYINKDTKRKRKR